MNIAVEPGTLLTIITIVAGVTLFSFLRSRHAERMQQLQMGIPIDNVNKSAFELKFGLLFAGVGVGIFLAYFINLILPQDTRELYAAFIFFFGGLGLLASFFIAQKHSGKS